MIAPLKEADIDIFVVLDLSYYKADAQAALLDKVKAVLKKTHPNMPSIIVLCIEICVQAKCGMALLREPGLR